MICTSTNHSKCIVVNVFSPFFSFKVLQQRLEQATKSKIYLIKKLDKSKEDVDDLRFQVNWPVDWVTFQAADLINLHSL